MYAGSGIEMLTCKDPPGCHHRLLTGTSVSSYQHVSIQFIQSFINASPLRQ